ncbi:MAG TPA: hypothetical protein VJY62_20540 [Bacteroidia bacterium]|nr:hypothetical protein [Bacteroidia bacterium]
MSKNTFCTIITADYFSYASVLYESLKSNCDDKVVLYVFISSPREDVNNIAKNSEGIKYLFVDDLCISGIGKKIKDKYLLVYIDGFRWSMKPVLINYLIQHRGYEKVIYVDWDIFFFSKYKFLFDMLDNANVLLTPHWRSSDPYVDPSNFQELYNRGLYNAGFVAANRDAVLVMDWWAKACEYVCVKEPSKGYFVDQTHLNLFHIMFEGIKVVRHRGCNVAKWNQFECKRIKKDNGEVLINGEYPIVFIHFTPSTIRGILNGTDKLLFPYLKQYADTIKKYLPGIDIIDKYKTPSPDLPSDSLIVKIITRLQNWLK